ncbi:hypothetical protein [Polaribacter sp. KT 15]|uniref:hypothetical protein n=1 Tax=Polaribacter sp. KT 15 TaxID=1896175 RepID=UPI00090B698F|nr:hypothetical protein [Polaribacter sp. KT 15]SHN04976.1 hypothetical protein SAMN05720268_2436 [Polaribacter sp. KT 15]
MKFKILLFLLFNFQCLNSQVTNWGFYDLDSIISVEMPDAVYEFDTIIESNKIYQMYSTINESNFIAQKFYLDNSLDLKLPTSKKELNSFYMDLAEVLNLLISSNEIIESKLIHENIEGYKLSFSDKKNINYQEIILYFLNNNLYIFIYRDANGLNNFNKSKFFNSIEFNQKTDINQYIEKKVPLKFKLFIALIAILILSYIVRFTSKKNTKY